MRDRDRRCETLLAGLDPIELARVATAAMRSFTEAAMTGHPIDATDEARAIGRRASAFREKDRNRYVDAVALASAARNAATLIGPQVAALAVIRSASVSGAAGWSLLAECVPLLDAVGVGLRARESANIDPNAPTAEGATAPNLADALAAIGNVIAPLREHAETQARELRELGAAAEREANELAALVEHARKRADDVIGVEPIPPALLALLSLARTTADKTCAEQDAAR